jgi:2-hydroxychromene-2-carboxylate isomerase
VSRPAKGRTPRSYFSFRSPYSWLAWHDLSQQRPDLLTSLDWRPFWEPDARSQDMLAAAGGRFIYTPMSREKHLYMLGDVRRLARRRGLEVTWPLDPDPNWEPSHLTYLIAVEHGRGLQYIDSVYQARWQQGRDINDPATVAQIAVEAGLPADAVQGAADDERVRKLGVQALLAMDKDDVFGVPFFIIGRQKFWGVDRLPDFLDALAGTDGLQPTASGAASTPASPPVDKADPDSSDVGHAGGCG